MVFLRGIRSYLASKLRIIISFIIVLLEMWERAITGVLTPADCSHYLAKETDNLATGKVTMLLIMEVLQSMLSSLKQISLDRSQFN